MTVRAWTVCCGVLAAGALAVAAGAWAQAPDAPGIFDQAEVARIPDQTPKQDGVEPLARGPVHEAFVEFARTKLVGGPVIAKKPPALLEEMPPAEKPADEDTQWICGYWSFDEERDDFLWVSGVWRVPPPDRQWVPGHWAQVDGGWQWVPGFWAPADAGDVEVVPAPPDQPPANDPVPPPPGPDHTFVPGCYVPRANGFTWRPPCYVENRPGWVYVPPHYCPCPTGFIFVEGYWDFALRSRGLLFAPAFIAVEYRSQPSFVYTPCYVVHDQALLGAMFVRQDMGYYFGDYFGARYQRAGYSSFLEIRLGGGYGYDPLFSYYRYENRGAPYWERDMVGLYAARRLGSVPPPPRTVAQQQALALSFSNGSSSISFGLVKQSIMVAPVGRVNPNVVAIQKLKHEQLAARGRQVKEQQELIHKREVAQARMIAEAKEARAKQIQAQQEAIAKQQHARQEGVAKQQQEQAEALAKQQQARAEAIAKQREARAEEIAKQQQAQKMALSLPKRPDQPQAKAPPGRKVPPPHPHPHQANQPDKKKKPN